MSQRELRSLNSGGTIPGTTHSRLRSGAVEQPRTMSASESEPAIESPEDVAEAPLVQELRQKLEMAAEERCDLSVQLQQMREASEKAKDECEEQRQRAQSLEDELTEKAQTLREVEEEYGRAKEFWETVRMKTELDGLKQLEEVRQQFELERDRHRKELERQEVVIEKLKQELAAEREKTSSGAVIPPGSPRRSSESVESVCVHGESTIAASSSRGVGTACSEEPASRKESHPKKVTFAEREPGSGEPVGSETRLSKGGSGESEVTTAPPLSSGGTNALRVSGVGAGVAGEQSAPEVPNGDGSGGEQGVSCVMQQLTQLVQTQTAMVAAQTRAVSPKFTPNIPL